MTGRRRYLLGAAAGVAILVGMERGADAVGIPVFDGATLAELIAQISEMEKQFALTMAQYTLQIKQYAGEYFGWITEYQQLVTEIAHYYNDAMMLLNFAHHPTYGGAMGLMNQAGLGNTLPFNPYSAMNLINGSSYGGGVFSTVQGMLNQLSNFAGGAYQQNVIYVPTDASWASDQVIANGNSVAAAQGMAMASYEGYREHMAVLPTLRQNAASADTIKDAADAQNMLTAETAWNLGQLGQQNALAWMASQQREARYQRDEERLACELEQWRAAVSRPCPKGNSGAMAGGGGGQGGGSAALLAPPAQPLTGVGGAPIAMQPQMPAPPAPPPQPPPFDPPAQQQGQPPPQTGG